MELYEILVPTVRNNGKPFRLKHHRAWDAKVRAIAGGLTIFAPTIKGEWTSPCGSVFTDRTIPVRIACSREQIDAIADLSAVHYEQLAVMYWLVSNEVVIRHYDPLRKYRKTS